MTPKDWNEIKKLLADVAKGNDVQEVLKKVENGVESSFRSPISMTSWGTSDGKAVTGTGKGVLFFLSPSNNTVTLTIDGVSHTCTMNAGNYFWVEFTSNFSVKVASNYACKGMAFFY